MRKLVPILPFVILSIFFIPAFTQPAVVNLSPYDVPAYRQAFFDAAKIYGKAGCGNITLAEMTAENSLKTGVPANLIAAIVSVESSCNPLAISKKGAVGLMQINVDVQSKAYDFSLINLFNSRQSMEIGTKILAGMIKQYGMKSGIQHYDGVGEEADAYVIKVLALAGK
jgi:soluble lytic murein transglycosylase-like protein